ncbi:hypothetical protein BBK82_33965 [Lentzea guizhouensis]|uniref:HTH tetR-type domain-containing protein n=1 Tax=Lentzea guizhouensis TaxID=1586287 RepID=A0A1B2HZV4_9PSEU|nr:TetR/AcrR family transcriptional regulator [Lentzea guizhouensis]ANZ43233.1 hypothetical protein BBK82_33965 [Lentzea guizhouensis]
MSTSPALRSDAVRNRALLIEAARTELAAHPGPLRLREVARRAGVGQGTLYRHFPTRDALLAALTVDRLEGLVEVFEATARADDDALEPSWRAAVLHGLETGRDRTFTEVLSTGNAADPETAALIGRFETALAVVVGRGQELGFVAATLTFGDVLRLICGAQHAVAMAVEVTELPERYTDVLLAGLRPSTRD